MQGLRGALGTKKLAEAPGTEAQGTPLCLHGPTPAMVGGGASISGAGALGSHVDTGYPPGLYPDTHCPSQKGTSSHWFSTLCAGGGGEAGKG